MVGGVFIKLMLNIRTGNIKGQDFSKHGKTNHNKAEGIY